MRTDSMRPPREPWCRRGVTLVEMLVVLTIVAMLLLLLFPALQTGREAARGSACRNNLRQMATALSGHVMQHDAFPNGGSGWWRKGTTGPWVEWGGSWIAYVLPFAEETNAFEDIRFG